MIKKITLLFFLTIISLGYSQTLPIDFESATTWADFDGGVVTTEANPFSNADNNSANVGKMVKNAGQVWAGSSLVLSSAMDFANNNTFTMKAYSVKAGTKVLLKVENSADANINFEKEVTMSVVNGWETLTFDYSAIPSNTYDKVVVIFDLGTMGDGTANFTYHFDDIELSNTTGGPTVALPIDFESATTWADFDGGVVTTEANPFSNADNNSANVGTMVKNAGQVWAGSSLVLSSAMDFANNNTFTMKAYSVKAGTKVLLKVENSGDANINFEKEVTMSVVNGWETLTFDYSAIPSNTYDKVVIIFDLGTMGDGTANFTYHFDDIELSSSSGGLAQIDLPVDFEGSTTDFTVTDFGGNSSSMVVDPEDSGNMVIQSIKTTGAATWAGTTIGTSAGFATNLPLSLSDSKMNIRVWSPDAGTPIRLKAEDASDATHTVETEINTTVAGGWETMEFDFSNQAPGTETLSHGLSNGWVYNKVSIFFNFGTDGATAGEKTYYFDDVKFGPASTASLEDLEKFGFKIYPNPASQMLKLTAASTISSIEIFDLAGRRMLADAPNSLSKELNIGKP